MPVLSDYLNWLTSDWDQLFVLCIKINGINLNKYNTLFFSICPKIKTAKPDLAAKVMEKLKKGQYNDESDDDSNLEGGEKDVGVEPTADANHVYVYVFYTQL